MKIKVYTSFLLAVLLLVPLGAALADTPTAVISAGTGSGNPGDTNIIIPVNLNSQDGAEVVGLNFDLSFDDSRLSVSNVSIGSAASSAGKNLSWSKPSSSTVRVIIFGFNQDAIPNGTVANVIFNVLVSAAPGTSPLTLSNAAATDSSGGGIEVNLNNGSFTVLSPPATNTPTSAPTDTPLPTSTFTPTITTTDAPIVTSTPTSTVAPTSSTTPTMTPSIGPSPTGGLSTTPAYTKTSIPSASATSESKPTSSVTPTPKLTVSPDVTTSPIGGVTASPSPKGIITAPTLAAEATSTALAGLEAAVAATATALAVIGQEPTKGVKAISGVSDWLGQWGDILLVGGVALGTTLLVGRLLFEVWKRRVSEESRKRIS